MNPENGSFGALVVFFIFAIPMPICMFIYHIVLWSTEQTAIASGSFANLEWAGSIGLAVQAVLMSGIIAALWYFTEDDRFEPCTRAGSATSLMAFPALALRFFRANNDHPGSIYQIFICLGSSSSLPCQVRKIPIQLEGGRTIHRLIPCHVGAAPFSVFGAFGSPTNQLLGLLARLSFGLLRLHCDGISDGK